MRFDTILIGGGLASLVCGIKLQRAGQKCLIVSAGQNALHFSSGTFGLLGRLPDGTAVSNPLEELGKLPGTHPYSKIGPVKVSEYAAEVKDFFNSCGVRLHGVAAQEGSEVSPNGYRLTPMGVLQPSWLAMEDVTLLPSKDELKWRKALIVNFYGFLDFNASFIAEGLGKIGVESRVETVKIEDVETLRKNPADMRSVGVARLMAKEKNWKDFGGMVRGLLSGEDLVIVPAVFGFGDQVIVEWLREMIPADVMFIGTMPPSVPGIRTQILLKKAFESAGGTFLPGDTALDPLFSGTSVAGIHTANLGSIVLSADRYVLASGNLFGKGLEASPNRVYEPVFGLDTDFPADRSKWCDPDFFALQEFAGFGVLCDDSFKAFKDGRTVDNLYVAGAEVGGCNPLYEGSGAGVSIMTAMSVADSILHGN